MISHYPSCQAFGCGVSTTPNTQSDTTLVASSSSSRVPSCTRTCIRSDQNPHPRILFIRPRQTKPIDDDNNSSRYYFFLSHRSRV